VQLQRFRGRGCVQLALEEEVRGVLAARVCVVERVGVAAHLLGPIQRLVGALEQFADILCVAREDRETNAGRRAQGVVGHGDRPAQRLAQAAHHHRGARGLAQVAEHKRELVAPHARHCVGLPHAGAQAVCDPLEQRVARRVPQGVVDALEAVKVDERHGDQRAGPPRVRAGLLEPVAEEQPVRQARQRVVVGQLVEMRLLALRDLVQQVVRVAEAEVAAFARDDEAVKHLLQSRHDDLAGELVEVRGLVDHHRRGVHELRHRTPPVEVLAERPREELDQLVARDEAHRHAVLDDGQHPQTRVAEKHLQHAQRRGTGPDRGDLLRQRAEPDAREQGEIGAIGPVARDSSGIEGQRLGWVVQGSGGHRPCRPEHTAVGSAEGPFS